MWDFHHNFHHYFFAVVWRKKTSTTWVFMESFWVIVVFRKDTSSLPALLRFYLCRRGAKGRPDTWAPWRMWDCFFLKVILLMVQKSGEKTTVWDGAQTSEKSMGYKRPTSLNCLAGVRTNHQQGFFLLLTVYMESPSGKYFLHFPTILAKSRNIFRPKTKQQKTPCQFQHDLETQSFPKHFLFGVALCGQVTLILGECSFHKF